MNSCDYKNVESRSMAIDCWDRIGWFFNKVDWSFNTVDWFEDLRRERVNQFI